MVLSNGPKATSAVNLALQHILAHYHTYAQHTKRPLFVGISGCQGSGKTTLCKTLAERLVSEHHLPTVTFSMDDLYLSHNDQQALALQHPTNRLLQKRGQAGSHDIPLGVQTFEALEGAQAATLRLPTYDKGRFNGEGDRCPGYEWPVVSGPVNIVLFEGWSLGFKPLPQSMLHHLYQTATPQDHPHTLQHPLQHLEWMNTHLAQYVDQWYRFLDIFVHLNPASLSYVYEWRLEQEHSMRQKTGRGMTDEAVRAFVDTYMPAYELYMPRLTQSGFFDDEVSGKRGGYEVTSKHLRITISRDRHVQAAETYNNGWQSL